MIYQAVCFDLDGTLLNTLDDIADCLNRVLKNAGYPDHPNEDYKSFVGDGMEVLVTRVLPEKERKPETIQRILNGMRQEYSMHWADKTFVYDGIEDLLSGLLKSGLKLAILSNKPDDFTRLMVSHYFPANLFAEVRGQRSDTAKKPDPAAALLISEKMGVKPSEFIYLGDSSTDMQTAKRAGMLAVGALWGFRSRKELLDYGAEFLLEKPVEMLSLIKQG